MQKVFEVEIEGVKRGFRFNMLAIGKACRIEQCDINELFNRVIGEYEYDALGNRIAVIRHPDVESMINFFHAAAINYHEGKSQEVNFTVQDVSDWLDHLGLERTSKMMAEALKTAKSKNQEAPIESGQ